MMSMKINSEALALAFNPCCRLWRLKKFPQDCYVIGLEYGLGTGILTSAPRDSEVQSRLNNTAANKLMFYSSNDLTQLKMI